jgi:hypothetical protein
MVPIWLIVFGVVGFATAGLQITRVKIVSDFNSTIINITNINSFILSSFAEYGVARIQMINAVHGKAL